MFGGTTDPEALKLSDEALNELIEKELRILLGAQSAPLATHITRWTRAIPVYSKELKSARESLHRKFCALPGRVIFSNYSREVSIRSLIEALLQL